MSREEVAGNVVILTIAGSETTATALAGAFYQLEKHPSVKAKVANELKTTFKNESEVDLNSVAEFNLKRGIRG